MHGLYDTTQSGESKMHRCAGLAGLLGQQAVKLSRKPHRMAFVKGQ